MRNYENCHTDEFEIRPLTEICPDRYHVTDRTDGDALRRCGTTETTTAHHRGRHCRCQTENPQMYISFQNILLITTISPF
jgi:hypothetical protein